MKLSLTASQGSDMLISALAKRIQSVHQGSRFIEWDEVTTFVANWTRLAPSFVGDLVPMAPRSAIDLLVGLGAVKPAGQAVLERFPDIDGRWHHDLARS